MLDLLKKISFAVELRFLGAWRLRKPAFNVFHRDPASRQRALLVYLATPFHLPGNHPAHRYHQNLRQAVQMATVLDEAGYIVDVVDMADTQFRAEKPYDLLLSHRVDHAGLESAMRPGTIKIYLAAGMNHIEHNRQLDLRAEYLFQRKGKRLANVPRNEERMPFLQIADALIGFGNAYIMDTWRLIFPGSIYGFENCSHREIRPAQRDWESAKRNFLFFGNRQQLRKGLDVTLDAFANLPNLHLYVCSRSQDEPDFAEIYKKELLATPNIHLCGWLDIGGSKFKELASRCGFVIFPSSTEGSPGSVINAMAAGMIPILTREAGIDVEGFGFLLPDARVETISAVVQSAAQTPPGELASLSQNVLAVTAGRYSEEAFINRWREIISDIIKTYGGR